MRRLTRSERDKKLTGLCGGLGAWLGIDATAIRLLVLVSALFSFGSTAVIYLLASLIVPRETYSGYTDGPYYY